MNNDEMNERLSALADGQLDAEELAAALAFAVDDENGRATWQLYHLVGAALRSPDLARPADPAFMPRLRAPVAKEGLAWRPGLAGGARGHRLECAGPAAGRRLCGGASPVTGGCVGGTAGRGGRYRRAAADDS